MANIFVFIPLTACKISGMDLFFVMDESGSVGFNNFQTMKSFVNEVIEGFEIGSDDVQVGVMTFSNNPKIHFHLNAYGDKSSLKAAVSSLPYRGGGTNTASALDTTRLSAFTEQNGGRPGTSGIPRVVVVITDGHSNSFTNTKVAAARLHEKKIIVFAIGISGANINELNEIASEVRYVEFVSTFDPVRLEALQVEISAEACEGISIYTHNYYNFFLLHCYNFINNLHFQNYFLSLFVIIIIVVAPSIDAWSMAEMLWQHIQEIFIYYSS